MDIVRPMLADKADLSRLVELCEDDDRGAEQKIDGDRLLMHVDGDGHVMPMSRKGKLLQGVSRPVLQAFSNIRPGERWVFDGEWLTEDKKYYVFDIIYGGRHSFLDEPFRQRRSVLEHLFCTWQPPACVKLVPIARTHEEKVELAQYVVDNNCEGLVFKAMDSTYRPSRGDKDRTTAWLKVKLRYEVDAVVTEVGRGGHDNVVLAVYRDGEEVEIGECTAKAGDGKRMRFSVGQVLRVTYQAFSKDGRLIQPTLPRLRQDKDPLDCLYEQLVHENKTVRM